MSQSTWKANIVGSAKGTGTSRFTRLLKAVFEWSGRLLGINGEPAVHFQQGYLYGE